MSKLQASQVHALRIQIAAEAHSAGRLLVSTSKAASEVGHLKLMPLLRKPTDARDPPQCAPCKMMNAVKV